MENKRPADIYVVDDRPIDNLISKLLFKKFDPDMVIDEINDGPTALKQLADIAANEPFFLPDFIFLDLNMPGMDGWEFMTEYKHLGIDNAKKIQIYILSSSLYRQDIQQSDNNPLIAGFISKPLTMATIKSILQPFDAVE
ncbi:response regulator [Mucilaginibacter conchicola]|uniref:Response regulator n=1 Tax=Mucilaginibacter conchicola TaxID=2303333 RepID=A0A372NMA2_9SPHI|nr:response regulator [Mucilaginibacter conchicola]RFZ90082.1 response regulator [Mucilaginibacter conchicola]